MKAISVPLDQAAATPFSPLSVPAIVAGGAWIPGQNVVDIGGGNREWSSLPGTAANTEGSIFTTTASFVPPVPATASNGAAVWDYPAPLGALIIPTAGPSLRWGEYGSYAGWFKANAADLAFHFMVEAWPNDGVNNRFFATKETPSASMDINGSPSGTGTDASPDRWKANYDSLTFTAWALFRWTFNFSLANYSISGANLSSRMRLYVNEVFVESDGYSAPPPPFSSPPSGPCLGPGLYTGPQRLCLGGNYISSNWNGQIGPFYVANETAGVISAPTWQDIMNYNRPA